MKTINQFIKELQSISEDKKELPLLIKCENGELVSPSIKMMWSDPMEIYKTPPDKMIITY